MKKILILFFSFILLVSCISQNENNYNFVKDYGIVLDVKQYEKYDPIKHTYTPIYNITVELKDTIINTITIDEHSIGDTIIYYHYKENN